MTRRTPLWVGIRPTADFLDDPRRGCMTPNGRVNNLFFGEAIEDLAACQAICVRCPVFRDCTRWTLANYDALEFGIFAGLNEHLRERLHAGVEQYYDWRQDWIRKYYSTARAKRLLRAGLGKRAQAKEEMPPCPRCGAESVVRNGRQGRYQRYHCHGCNRNFQGERL